MIMRKVIITGCLLLAGCATPQTVLQNDKGYSVVCGGSSTGSVLGGMIGYSIQKTQDNRCVKDAMSAGYAPVKIGDIQVNAK